MVHGYVADVNARLLSKHWKLMGITDNWRKQDVAPVFKKERRAIQGNRLVGLGGEGEVRGGKGSGGERSVEQDNPLLCPAVPFLMHPRI